MLHLSKAASGSKDGWICFIKYQYASYLFIQTFFSHKYFHYLYFVQPSDLI